MHALGRAPDVRCCGSATGARRSRSSTCRCVVIALYAFNERRDRWRGRSPGFTLDWFEQALAQPGRARRARGPRSRRRSARRLIALVLGHARRARGRALPLLRARDDLVPRRSCRSRCPGIVTGMALERDLHAGARRRPLGLFTIDRRPRHVLHRRRLQQRVARLRRTSARRSRRRRPTSAPTRWQTFRLRHVPAAALGAARRRRCSRSRCRSTRSIVTTFTAGARRRRCRSGSSATSRGRTSCRS